MVTRFLGVVEFALLFGCFVGISTTRKPPSCSLPVVVGQCRASFPRYFYDSKADKCKPFVYGGCGGNANNFESVEQCENACMKSI
ncbi:Kunitz/Bovine pancreatic trypsin inhibitor domain protein [Opisthorchis viverrini]|uniref:Kunitz/Bovine pancreatic trypsin inhibitor domain protein n=1 Tax=Opisthorchis viverrini TaxID=6198 RepID=A0A1S8XAI4_OPIVI|nr:Kunitz/Bovine pancreatic trypsin inhibitor domain protein [Opisthorchis viverrini]